MAPLLLNGMKKRVSGSRSTNLHIICFEGKKTEPAYFNALIKKYSHPFRCNIVSYIKSESEDTSNPKKLLVILLSHLENYTFKEKIKFSKLINLLENHNVKNLKSIILTITDTFEKNKYKEIDYIEVLREKEVDNRVIIDYQDFVRNFHGFNEEEDKIHLVVDRDNKSFTKEQYN